MQRHLDQELAELKRSLATMGSLVDRALTLAIESILSPTATAREQARTIEDQLDASESAIEERCHQIIVLQHPLARDLRLVVATLRIISDLEQIGDLAEGVSKRAAYIARHDRVRNPDALPELTRVVLDMVRRATDAFVAGGDGEPKTVIVEEEQADALTKQCYGTIQENMVAEPGRIREYTHLLRAVSNLEQIADLAVSVAEEAVFLHRAQSIRHHHQDLK